VLNLLAEAGMDDQIVFGYLLTEQISLAVCTSTIQEGNHTQVRWFLSKSMVLIGPIIWPISWLTSAPEARG
jgi:hypothetical protein